MSYFFLKNGAKRSAQSFPIDLPEGIKFGDAKHAFAEMLAVSPEQIIRLTTADGMIVLPGQGVPEGALVLEVEKSVFDAMTGSGEGFSSTGSSLSMTFLCDKVLPTFVVFSMFAGFAIILGGLASASQQCQDEDVAASLQVSLFTWVPSQTGINLKFTCGLALSLFWWIIGAEFVLCIVPAIVFLFFADSFSADIKGSWAYIITCALNILTALLAFEAFTVVPAAYYADVYQVPKVYVKSVQVMAAGVITLLAANFFWIIFQAFGKMMPVSFKCCGKSKAAPAYAPSGAIMAV